MACASNIFHNSTPSSPSADPRMHTRVATPRRARSMIVGIAAAMTARRTDPSPCRVGNMSSSENACSASHFTAVASQTSLCRDGTARETRRYRP